MSILRNYKSIERIYADSHFNLCRAIRKSDKTLVLIKTVNPKLISLDNNWLENEDRITKNISDRHIIKSYCIENYYNSRALVLKDFAGQNLVRFVENNAIAPEDFLNIAIRLVEILQTVHQHQIIHHNIQPGSIFIDQKTLEIKITNFVIATNINDRPQAFSQQLEVTNLAYISPEQTERTNLNIDYRTDFYSLGIIFYQILTGRLPYIASDSLELMHCHLSQVPASPHQLKPGISETLSTIIMKLIAKNPQDRYQNAYGIIADLKSCRERDLSRDNSKPFVCGKFDRYGQFAVSTGIYGRDDAINLLQSALDRVYSGAIEMILIEGSSGIGKTTFIRKIIPEQIQQRDNSIAGKCEQLARNVPYEVIIQAFSNLIRQLLTETAESLGVWRAEILLAVEANGKIITDILPDLELIIGVQPDIPALSAKETQNRFNRIFIKFIQVFARHDRPLILSIDDLQWIDSASLQLLEFLSNNLDRGYLLIVATYRHDELSKNRLLSSAIERIRSTITVNDIELLPLNLDDINRLLIDTLECDRQDISPLAKLLYDRTQGNPFFLHQLLKTLHSEKLITFDFDRLVWQWQIEEIQRTAIANYNVVDLVINNLTKLPVASQKIVNIAACIGEWFDLTTIAIAYGKTRAQTAKELDRALKSGIILLDYPQSTLDGQRLNSYRFLNDRVRETAYSMLDEVDRVYIHLRIGRYLLQQTESERIEEQIFNLVKHFNIGRKLFSLGSFGLRLAEFNLIAAKKAKSAIAYEVAANYLNIALELLLPFERQLQQQINKDAAESSIEHPANKSPASSAVMGLPSKSEELSGIFETDRKTKDLSASILRDARSSRMDYVTMPRQGRTRLLHGEVPSSGSEIIRDWKEYYLLRSNIYLEASEIQYLLTNFTRAEQLADIVLSKATISLKVRAYQIKIHTHIAQNKMQLAIEEGLDILELLEVSLAHNSTYRDALQARLKRDCQSLNLAKLPQMTDSVGLAAMEILATIIPPIQIVKPQLFPRAVLKMVHLSEQYGNCPLSAYAYALYGLWLCATGNVLAGYQLGKLATTFPEQFELKAIKSKVEFIFNSMVRHWVEPAISTLESFSIGIEAGIEVGDIEHACFHAQYYCTYLFLVGEPLATAEEKSLRPISSIQNFKQYFQLNYARIWLQLNQNLQGRAKDELLLIGESFDESKMLPFWYETNNATSLFALYLAKLILCYFLKGNLQAIINGSQAQQYLNTATGSMCYGVYHFYYPLALLAVYSTRSNVKSSDLSKIKLYQQQLKQWAVHAPKNYQHRYDLVTAEIARVSGDNEQAAEHYDRAIAAAEQAGYLQEAALAAELTGEFYLSLNRIKIAKLYLNEAYDKYQLWGASAKIANLKRRHPQLLIQNYPDELIHPGSDRSLINSHRPKSDRAASLANLDLFSVIKASQAISSEIILDNLISKMMDIVMENAGARKSILFLQQGSSLVIAASATVTSENQVVLPYVPIAEYSDIPTSIINYVRSTRSTVILDRATKEGIFTKDAYVTKHQPKSILCCPIIYQNQLQGIIYLENSLVEAAFTPQKAEILQVLLFQVSISIENARLYKNLENHASVKESLAQKEILLKEIHHRVKNNLLVVSSLLDLQSSYIDDDKVNKLLENCQNRITAMALVHQHLYGNSELNKINFAQYIESLVDNLAYLHGSKDRINIILEIEPIEINIESANPCGLIVNELVSNALEHGFSDRTEKPSIPVGHQISDRGNIWLSLKTNSQRQNVLTIRDDGVGFKEGLDLYNSDSLGLELVCTLVEQIDGEIELIKTNGTEIKITFAELDYHSRI